VIERKQRKKHLKQNLNQKLKGEKINILFEDYGKYWFDNMDTASPTAHREAETAKAHRG